MEQTIDYPDYPMATEKPRKWYNAAKFPLVPVFIVRKANKYNTSGFSFDWLFIRIWSRDSFDFEVALTIDPTHWGIGLTALLPYLRVVLCLPFPYKIGCWFQKNMWRKPKGDSNY